MQLCTPARHKMFHIQFSLVHHNFSNKITPEIQRYIVLLKAPVP